jgi:nucleotide-binding universal stress UspA family protein
MSGKQSQDGHRQLGRARETLEAANIDVTDSLIPGDAESIIARTVQEKGIDLLVMGAYGHSPLRSLFFGSKTSDLLRSATIPTLLIR